MRPVEFEGQSTLLNPPKNLERGLCGALPVKRVSDVDYGLRYDSMWKPTVEELAMLNQGAAVRLCIMGPNHPPVWVDVMHIQELP